MSPSLRRQAVLLVRGEESVLLQQLHGGEQYGLTVLLGDSLDPFGGLGVLEGAVTLQERPLLRLDRTIASVLLRERFSRACKLCTDLELCESADST